MELRSGKTMDMDSSAKRRKTGPEQEPEPDYWSAVPGEILGLIVGKIVSVGDLLSSGKDLVMLSAVCRSWNSVATDLCNKLLNIGPVYMAGTGPARSVMLRDPNPSATSLVLYLPETAGSRCWGSPFGWLVTSELADLRLNLLNPFTGATIALPSLPKSICGGRRFRAFLTANPESDPDDCLVVIVSGCWKSKLAFVRPGKRKWSHIHCDFNPTDLVRSNGELYGLNFSPYTEFYGLDISYILQVRLFLIQLNHRGENGRVAPRAVQTLTLTPPPGEEDEKEGGFWPRIYLPGEDTYVQQRLVDLDGELCLCVRYFVSTSTVDFKIFKIDLSNGNLTRIPSLGDYCLFLGNNYSFSWKASYIPTNLFEKPRRDESSELVRNCVFYAYYYDCNDLSWENPWVEPPFDVNAYAWDMSSGSTKVCERNDSPTLSFGPLWFLPSINFPKL